LGPDLDDGAANVWPGRPRRWLEFPHPIPRPHPDPDKATSFSYRVRLGPLSQPLRGSRRFRWHVHHVAFDIELPAVIEAAQTAFFVATERKRGAAMQAIFSEHPELSVGIPEDDQVLTEQPRSRRRTIGLGNFLGHAYRKPVATHNAAHGRMALDSAKKLVLLSCQHSARERVFSECVIGRECDSRHV